MNTLNKVFEGKNGEYYRIIEENQVRRKKVCLYGMVETRTTKTKILVLNLYEHIVGIEMTWIKSFKIGHQDSPYYQSEKQEALERLMEWVKKQK